MEEHRPRTGWTFGGDIVPGMRIGNFVLGLRVGELIPEDSEATIAEYAIRHEVLVGLEAGRLVDLSTGSHRFATAEGFKPGGAFADVVAAWGEPPERRDVEGGGLFDFKAAWPGRGVDVAVKDGRILYIGVFPPV